MSQFTPRGDLFYYLEVWDKRALRDLKIGSLLGSIVDVKPQYVAGSQARLDKQDDIHQSLFWKTRETAEFRIECLCRREEVKNDYEFIIKYLTREEFINSIPDNDSKYIWGYWKRNVNLKQEEILYLERKKNHELGITKDIRKDI